MGIEAWSTTPASNNDAPPEGAPEGMAPSTVNNVIRQQMADHRAKWNDAQWFEYGDGDGAATLTYVAAAQFKVEGIDVSAAYHMGRRVKIVAATPGTIYGAISAVAFSTDTTVTVAFDSGVLSNEALTVSLGIFSATNVSIPRGVVFADTDGDTKVQVEESSDEDIIRFDVAGAEVAQFAGTNMFIGDTANAGATQGLTINQGAADNEILSLKSSDVNHSLTDDTEADTYGQFQKIVAGGGLEITGHLNAGIGLLLQAHGVPGTTKSTAGVGGVTTDSYKTSGTGRGDHVADTNLLVIQSNGLTRFIFDHEGTFHADVGSTTFDDYDDALVGRAYTLERGDPIRTEWDRYAEEHQEALVDLKIIGRISDEERAAGDRPLVNMTYLQLLDHGAIWQGYQRQLLLMQVLEEEMPGITAKMQARLSDAQLPRLPL